MTDAHAAAATLRCQHLLVRHGALDPLVGFAPGWRARAQRG